MVLYMCCFMGLLCFAGCSDKDKAEVTQLAEDAVELVIPGNDIEDVAKLSHDAVDAAINTYKENHPESVQVSK